jgi:hypothetical protein
MLNVLDPRRLTADSTERRPPGSLVFSIHARAALRQRGLTVERQGTSSDGRWKELAGAPGDFVFGDAERLRATTAP